MRGVRDFAEAGLHGLPLVWLAAEEELVGVAKVIEGALMPVDEAGLRRMPIFAPFRAFRFKYLKFRGLGCFEGR